MRAVRVERFGGPETLVVRDIDPPRARADEVVIDVQVAGVNFPDILVVNGSYQILPSLPFTPGKEVAGVVSELGPGVTQCRLGDRVMAQLEHGGYQERVSAPVTQVYPLPDGLGFREAASFGLGYLTAHFALVRRARLQPGETVLVTGAGGGVGSAAVQLAKALRATVLAVAQDDRRAALARSQGADAVLTCDPTVLRDHVRALTDGRGADVVVELVGGEVFHAALRSTAWEGRLVAVGFASGDIPAIKAGHILVKNMSVLGLQVSDYREREPGTVKKVMSELLGLYAAGRLGVPLAASYPLESASLALDMIRKGSAYGKVVLTVVPGPEIL